MIGYLEKNKKLALTFLVLIAIEIFLVSSIPGKKVEVEAFDASTLYHIIVFFLLTFFIMVSVSGKRKVKAKYVFFSIISATFYAALDEVHQIFIPSRTASTSDFVVDTFGILLAIIVYLYYKGNSNHLKRK